MSVFRNFGKLLAITVLLFIIQGGFLVALDSRDKVSPMPSKNSYLEKNSSTDQSGNSFSSSKNDSDGSVSTEEENFHPFTLSQNKIATENVAGVRIKGEKIVLFGYDNHCSVENLAKDFDFSDMNFFKQYPKLISVELNKLSLKRNVLENLQKFLPPTLKSLIIRFCTMESDDNELLVNIIKKHRTLENIVMVFPDMDPKESTNILGALKINGNVKSLSFVFGKLSDEGSKHLIDLIINSAKSLQELSLGWMAIAGKDNTYRNITNAILKITELQKLEWSVLSLSEKDIGFIAGAIGNMKNLLVLKIFLGDLSKHDHVKLFENIEILQQSLVNLKKLDTLDLSDMKMPNDVMQLIV
ncbi:MAG: hypothetical protein LBF44_00765, partial [Holosporaceae bacterium]|nr:hypothetical protein [Holosporaceae bacterium]